MGGQVSDLATDKQAGQYLIFMLGDCPFTLNIESIKKIVKIPSQGHTGGENLDLRRLFNLPVDINSDPYTIEVTSGEKEASFSVDKVVGIKDLQLTIPMPFPEILRTKTNKCIRSLFFDGLQMMCELDIDELFRLAWSGALHKEE